MSNKRSNKNGNFYKFRDWINRKILCGLINDFDSNKSGPIKIKSNGMTVTMKDQSTQATPIYDALTPIPHKSKKETHIYDTPIPITSEYTVMSPCIMLTCDSKSYSTMSTNKEEEKNTYKGTGPDSRLTINNRTSPQVSHIYDTPNVSIT